MHARPMLPLTLHANKALTLDDLRAGQRAAIVDMLEVDAAVRRRIVVDGREWRPADLIFELLWGVIPR